VAAACSLTACLSSAFSCWPTEEEDEDEDEVGGMGEVVKSEGDSFAGRRYRWDEEDIVSCTLRV
jgi:hypothetical protein